MIIAEIPTLFNDDSDGIICQLDRAHLEIKAMSGPSPI
jgi:hypothetical protein